MTRFCYDAAFERNLGWFTEAEQLALRGKRVAIAGMGGVGGVHLITLVRLGIGAFHIADFDHFSLANFNRQIGANVNTIDRPKAEVLEEMARAINPELRITRFDEGVTEQNLESFLKGVDLFVDGFDFFVMNIRRRVYQRCHELGIPAICAAPIGMSTGFLAFDPNGMSFEQYFRMEGRSENEQFLRFYVGLVPKLLHRCYLADPARLNLVTRTGPSTGAACELCAGVAAVTAVKLLLRRGDVKPAPWNHHYDAFRGILATTKLRDGLNGPVQRLKLKLFGSGILARMYKQPPPPATFSPDDAVDEILHAARWAPSGDNEQPWSFEKLGPETVLVHVARQDGGNIYHYRNDEPNLLAAGALLESLRIAASAHGRGMAWRLDGDTDPLRLHVTFFADETVVPDPLYSALGLRSVDRKRYRIRKLTGARREALEAALGGALRIDWYETAAERWRFARLSALATSIRLRAPETLPVHQHIIEWDKPLSADKIPAGALGLRRSTLRLMRWALGDRRRMEWLNRLGGADLATLEMDYAPILFSSAAFTLRFPAVIPPGQKLENLLRAGEHIQRFWLVATQLGLALQPAMAVLIFAHYGQTKLSFTKDIGVRAKAGRLAREFHSVFGAGPEDFVFMGRIGEPLVRIGVCRSVRKPVATLMSLPHEGDIANSTEPLMEAVVAP
jgi:sulfur-carrier protein adenylyltransferase/sulfurtransferase